MRNKDSPYLQLWSWLDDEAHDELALIADEPDRPPSLALVRALSRGVTHVVADGRTVPVISWPAWSGGSEDSRSARVDARLLDWVRGHVHPVG